MCSEGGGVANVKEEEVEKRVRQVQLASLLSRVDDTYCSGNDELKNITMTHHELCIVHRYLLGSRVPNRRTHPSVDLWQMIKVIPFQSKKNIYIYIICVP